jgi:hypothetical protein
MIHPSKGMSRQAYDRGWGISLDDHGEGSRSFPKPHFRVKWGRICKRRGVGEDLLLTAWENFVTGTSRE